jgi:hypothetical protein
MLRDYLALNSNVHELSYRQGARRKYGIATPPGRSARERKRPVRAANGSNRPGFLDRLPGNCFRPDLHAGPVPCIGPGRMDHSIGS